MTNKPKQPMKTDQPKPKMPMPEMSLVGRCFHIFDDAGCVQYQGIVRGNLGDGNYLVQYYEWFAGAASTLAVVHISKMIQPHNHRAAGAWQFYEDNDHMNSWYEYEHHAPKRELVTERS
jgi:hypothetical protein